MWTRYNRSRSQVVFTTNQSRTQWPQKITFQLNYPALTNLWLCQVSTRKEISQSWEKYAHSRLVQWSQLEVLLPGPVMLNHACKLQSQPVTCAVLKSIWLSTLKSSIQLSSAQVTNARRTTWRVSSKSKLSRHALFLSKRLRFKNQVTKFQLVTFLAHWKCLPKVNWQGDAHLEILLL